MEIKKNSWHYKLMRHNRSIHNLPTSLCEYFWAVMWSLTIYVGIALLGILVFYLFIVMPILGVVKSNNSYFIPIIGLGALIAACCIAAFFNAITEYFQDRRREKRYQRENYPKNPGLIKSYLAAKKEKICPLITYK